jgi:UDP-N-acetylglucosamine 2-epimerase
MVWSQAKSVLIFTKFKMVTSVKARNVSKECCNPLNVCHSPSSKKNLRPVLDLIKRFLVFRKHRESAINVGKLQQICLKVLEMQQTVSSSLEYNINKKEDLNSFKIEQTNLVSSLNMTVGFITSFHM